YSSDNQRYTVKLISDARISVKVFGIFGIRILMPESFSRHQYPHCICVKKLYEQNIYEQNLSVLHVNGANKFKNVERKNLRIMEKIIFRLDSS
ncbi:MAG: hypothetical protein LBG28_14730, partial [Tannerella sp.]|nr:hypothetical protein [Tannerella sp.]